jgi:hypothetical protein
LFERPYLGKKKSQKRAGGVAQVVIEHLPSNMRLSSNSIAARKKKKKTVNATIRILVTLVKKQGGQSQARCTRLCPQPHLFISIKK